MATARDEFSGLSPATSVDLTSNNNPLTKLLQHQSKVSPFL